MADDMTVKNVQLWSLHRANRKGMLADVLEPLAAAGANLRVVMGYRHTGELERATVEVFPVEGAAVEAVARKAGFAPSETACILVEGTDRKGLGAQISRSLSDAGISMAFLMEETVGRRFSAVIGFVRRAGAAPGAETSPGLPRTPRQEPGGRAAPITCP